MSVIREKRCLYSVIEKEVSVLEREVSVVERWMSVLEREKCLYFERGVCTRERGVCIRERCVCIRDVRFRETELNPIFAAQALIKLLSEFLTNSLFFSTSSSLSLSKSLQNKTRKIEPKSFFLPSTLFKRVQTYIKSGRNLWMRAQNPKPFFHEEDMFLMSTFL